MTATSAETIASDIDDLERAVATMTRVGYCLGPSFSPDGSRVAFISNLSGLPQVWTMSSSGGWPEQVTALDDPVESVSWSPDESWLAFSLAPGGGMNSQIYLVRPDGLELQRLTAGGKENNWLGPWSHDGRSVFLASNQHQPDSMDSYQLDITSRQMQLVARNEGTGRIMDVSRHGRFAVLYRRRQRSDSDLFLLHLETGHEIHLTPHQGPGNFNKGRCTRDGSTVFLSSDKDRDLTTFGRVRLDEDGKPGPIETLAARDDAELENFEVTEDGTTAALVWNVAGRHELALLDLNSLTLLPCPPLPVEIVVGLTFSRDGRRLALTLSGSAHPVNIWMLDRESGEMKQLTNTPHAGVDLAALARPELVRFPAHDGLQLTGWLYRALNSNGPGPVVLDFHGGPEGQSQPNFNTTYQALLSQELSVFAPNVRGSSGFGKLFVNLDNGPLRFDAVEDIRTCAEFLVNSSVADPGKIGIMGGSYGGYMTMAGLTEYPSLFAAGANLFGIVNFETFFAHTEPWMAAISKIEYGDPDTERDLLRSLSPIHKIERVTAPTLVLHGANDTNVPVVEAEQVVASLKDRGVPCEYVLFPDEGHGFRKAQNRIRAAIAIVRWFKTHLAP